MLKGSFFDRKPLNISHHEKVFTMLNFIHFLMDEWVFFFFFFSFSFFSFSFFFSSSFWVCPFSLSLFSISSWSIFSSSPQATHLSIVVNDLLCIANVTFLTQNNHFSPSVSFLLLPSPIHHWWWRHCSHLTQPPLTTTSSVGNVLCPYFYHHETKASIMVVWICNDFTMIVCTNVSPSTTKRMFRLVLSRFATTIGQWFRLWFSVFAMPSWVPKPQRSVNPKDSWTTQNHHKQTPESQIKNEK